jgi:formylglycine-generating enzyme required for sulfatase activity
MFDRSIFMTPTMQKIFAVFMLLGIMGASGPLSAATDLVIVPPMVTVAGGQFAMGSTENPTNPNFPTSVPVHRVQVKTFRLSKYETTVKQFRQFVEATGYKTGSDCWKLAANDWGMEYGNLSWDSPANAPTEYHPVMCVSYNDAHAYLEWLSKQTGKHYRLPSEAEWEYAARARSNTRYPFGDNPAELCRFANAFDQSGKGAIAQPTGKTREAIPCDDRAELTTVVGMYKPNAFGLYDMLGNVGEFVEDCQHLSYENAPADGRAWIEGCAAFHGGKMAIHRGGSYNGGPVGASPTIRGHAGLDNRSSLGEGFRIAEDMDEGTDQAAGAAQSQTDREFEAGLITEQAAERARHAKRAMSPRS